MASASVRPELIERVESGRGSDRELDLDVCLAIGHLQREKNDVFYIDEDGARVFGGHGWEIITPNLTGSLDRVLALIEQRMPGWCPSIVQTLPEFLNPNDRPWRGDLMGNVREESWGWGEPPEINYDTYGGEAHSAARALLAACLRAIEDQARTLADANSKNPLSEGRERS